MAFGELKQNKMAATIYDTCAQTFLNILNKKTITLCTLDFKKQLSPWTPQFCFGPKN